MSIMRSVIVQYIKNCMHTNTHTRIPHFDTEFIGTSCIRIDRTTIRNEREREKRKNVVALYLFLNVFAHFDLWLPAIINKCYNEWHKFTLSNSISLSLVT